MSWKLTARAIDENGSWERSYTHDDVDSPEFARGFVSGFAAAHGIPAELLTFEFEESV
jgi:hypothetical protein